MSAIDVMSGMFNNILDKEKDLFSTRMKICKDCKLYKKDDLFGPICNSKLYINPKTNETTSTKKDGFFKGCGCMLKSKTRVKNAKCPINKW